MTDPDLFTTTRADSGGRPLPLGSRERPGIFDAAWTALRRWTTREWAVAVAGTLLVGGLIGLSTVLIPNGWFGREIDSVAWNYPVWMIVSVLSGMLFATYLRPSAVASVNGSPGGSGSSTDAGGPATAEGATSTGDQLPADRESRMGMVGVVLGWFAVGCPVCNKIALIALGYTGALRWFAPVQPLLAVAAIALSGVALLWRLRGQVWCPAPSVARR